MSFEDRLIGAIAPAVIQKITQSLGSNPSVPKAKQQMEHGNIHILVDNMPEILESVVQENG